MGRLHLMELEDQAWMPQTLRDAATAYLLAAVRLNGQLKFFMPKFKEAIKASQQSRVVDLCSGGGGPALLMAQDEGLKKEFPELMWTLTDLYPHQEMRAAIGDLPPDKLKYFPKPVDARHVPKELRGMRTIFNAFHHFRPQDAKQILQSAIDDKAPIVIFEFVGRSPAFVLGMLFAPIMAWLTMLRVRPRKLSWLFFTYVIPVLPLFILWDGLVSCLRVYTPDELEDLVTSCEGHETFRWDIGKIKLGNAPLFGSYLLGIPRKE